MRRPSVRLVGAFAVVAVAAAVALIRHRQQSEREAKPAAATACEVPAFPPEPAFPMHTFLSRLGTPAASRKALQAYAAPSTDIRPMRWRSYESTSILCRYAQNDAECYEVAAVHETTASGYTSWSTYRICWRDDRIQRIELLREGVALDEN